MIRSTRNFLYLTLFVLLLACDNKIEIVNQLPVPKTPLIEFSSPNSPTQNYLEQIEDFGNYEIKYIGPNNSKIVIDENAEVANKANYLESIESYEAGSKNTVKIVVDTRQRFQEINSQTQNTYQAYPIIVTNISKETVRIGMGENLNLLLLGKEKDGNWKVIDKGTTYSLSFEKIQPLLLAENQIAISLVGITNGNTEVIMKYIMANDSFENIAESNEFNGRIDNSYLEN